MGWKRILLALPFVFGLSVGNGCSMAARPTIRVGIGMTVDELRKGSTYQFKDEALSFQSAPGQRIQYPPNPNLRDWMITEPYNLIYVYKGHELKKDDIGGDNYLLAITTEPLTQRIGSIRITFQNRALTLDEALAEAKMLSGWFVQAGFHPPAPDAPDAKEFAGAFTIGGQERHAPPYGPKITNYADARAAFLDTRSQIMEIVPFQLATDDAQVGLQIVNARRKREDVGGGKDESSAATEREYFLDLSIIPRPWNRYEGTGKRP